MRAWQLSLAATLIVGCSVGDRDDDANAQRKADELADHVDAVQDDVDDCLDALTGCLDAAVDADDFAACGDDAATCFGAVEPPEPPDPPDIPDDIGVDCADDLTTCVENDPTDPTCFDAFDDCLSGDLDGLCEAAHQSCLDAGVPSDFCDAIAC